jgi:hypothetical protein
VQKKVEEEQELSRTQAVELSQLKQQQQQQQQKQDTISDTAASEEVRSQLDRLKAENKSLSELLSEQRGLVQEHTVGAGAEASTASRGVSGSRAAAEGRGDSAAVEGAPGSAEVERWRKQALELAAENAELKSQAGAAEGSATEARQVGTF